MMLVGCWFWKRLTLFRPEFTDHGSLRASLCVMAGFVILLNGCSGEQDQKPSASHTELVSAKPEDRLTVAETAAREAAGTSGLPSGDQSPVVDTVPRVSASGLTSNDFTSGLPKEIQTVMDFRPMHAPDFPSVVPRNGEQHGYTTILESLGSGAAAFDSDGDGWLDAVVAGGGDFQERICVGEPVFLLKQRGSNFCDVTAVAGLAKSGLYHHGLAAADIDNDGFQDLLVTGYGGVQLFMNLGDGTFYTAASEQVMPFDSSRWCCSAAWADFNNDGCLDAFVATYVDWSFQNDPPCYAADGVTRDNCSPKLFASQPDLLFISLQDGKFRESADQWGLREESKALGVVAADLDLDGWTDLYVGNDVMINHVYQNRQGQGFTDATISSGAGVSSRGTPDASMGVDVADFNGDNLPDIWAANFELESFAVYRNQGRMLFRNVSDFTGVSALGGQFVGWGSSFNDFDLDGDVDIVVCNGNVVKYPRHSPVQQRMLLLENINGEYFEEVAAGAGTALVQPRDGRGLAVGDWNADGLPDLLITPVNAPASLLINHADVTGEWLKVRLIGLQSSRQPIGARLELHLSDRVLSRQLKGGGSYASSSSSDIHFGIPAGTRVDELIIHWPAGEVTKLMAPSVGRCLTVLEDGRVF